MVLTKQMAEERSSVIMQESISYIFHMSLQLGLYFEGLSEIEFELLYIPKKLSIDLKSQDIKKFKLNGEDFPVKKDTDGFVYLAVEKLIVGKNAIAISYKNKYCQSGKGCVSYTQELENPPPCTCCLQSCICKQNISEQRRKQYLYTQFQAYFAHHVFALFDQPDLKARMALNIICPSIWTQVLSNEHSYLQCEFNPEQYLKSTKTNHQEMLQQFLKEKTGKMTMFPLTELLPTYVLCFVAGEYEELKLEESKRYNGIPMSLYSIEPRFKNLQQISSLIFDVTIETMKFYEHFFGRPFAFKKFDQIFVHHYLWLGMENCCIVTYNDESIADQKTQRYSLMKLVNTIAHEVSHHWFGNLVTMKWWDDLWLNESFADFISYFCLERIKGNIELIKNKCFKSAFEERKHWGYKDDQLETTHPIRCEVFDTERAENIFDGITYAKGAAVIKQLMFLMTQEQLSKAFSAIVHNYQWKNATILDFLDIMQHYFLLKEFDLIEWKSSWLETKSLNVIEAEWNPSDTEEKCHLIIKQRPSSQKYPTLRYHKIKIGLFKDNLEVDVIETLIPPIPQHIVEYDGTQNYKAILLNYEDHAFVKVNIDETSLTFFRTPFQANNDGYFKIKHLKSELARSLVWNHLFEMLKNNKINAYLYVDVVINCVMLESDAIFERIFKYSSIQSFIKNYAPYHDQNMLSSKLFQFILKTLPNIPEQKQNRIKIFQDLLMEMASSQDQLIFLLKWQHQQLELKYFSDKKLTLKEDWNILMKIVSSHHFTKDQKLLQIQLLKHRSDDDQKEYKRYLKNINSYTKTKEQFQKQFEEFVSVDKQYYTENGIISSWKHPYFLEWLKQHKERYIQKIIRLIQKSKDYYFFIYEFQPFMMIYNDDHQIQWYVNYFTNVKQEQKRLFQQQKQKNIELKERKLIQDFEREEKEIREAESETKEEQIEEDQVQKEIVQNQLESESATAAENVLISVEMISTEMIKQEKSFNSYQCKMLKIIDELIKKQERFRLYLKE